MLYLYTHVFFIREYARQVSDVATGVTGNQGLLVIQESS